MTLNVVLTTARTIHVGADFRLTNGDTGKLITDVSPKILVIREEYWQAVLTYTGVGRWKERDTSDWVTEWLKHEPGIIRTFDETAAILEREGIKWLSDIRRKGRFQGRHSFVLAGLVGGRSRLALVSNYDRINGPPPSEIGQLATELLAPRIRVLVTGMAQAVPIDVQKFLEASLRRGDDVNQIQRHIGRAIATAAQTPEAANAVSAASFTYSVLSGNRGQGHLHGDVQDALQVVTLVNGADPLTSIRGLMGPKTVIIPTGHVSIGGTQSTKTEQCDLELENTLDREGEISGFRIKELQNMGSGHAEASGINSIGQIIGQSSRTDGGPLLACLWDADGNPIELLPGALSSWAFDINDLGRIAGTLHLNDGATRAFLMTSKGLRVGETLGGFHSNAHALNNRGEVVGGSWSIPGNTAGDKRERAFRWLPSEGMQDLGALADDWCSRAADINDEGIIVGFSFPRFPSSGSNKAFVWTSSLGIADLGSLDGSSAAATAVNNRGEVIGLTSYRGLTVSFIWTRESGMRLLPLPEKSCAQMINDLGNIVYTRDTPQGSRAFLSQDGREIALPCYRGHQSEPADINNRGVIVGHMWRGNHKHAVQWSPIK